ncbi:PREDICTED: uncharacterized protein LOC109464941, partial [Branchiostoma belcheri]|uniref:Uncharacterized protein LOC109464941 n=1 Tax=Branchiostoma belcheri TaxID=7741 RepID=A0A6P4YFR1_BRABE
PKPCGNFPWDTDDVTVSCNYTYTDVKQWGSTEPPIVLQGRCTVTCLPEADMLVGPPYSDDSYGYGVEDGAYYCNVGNSTWMGAEPVCLGGYDNSNVITDDTNTVRLVGGEFYGCVELYDDVTRQWGPVRGWSAYRQDRMSWADLACRNLGFREGLATAAYRLTTSGDVSSSWVSPLQYHYRQSHPFYPSTVPKFVVSQTLPQWENATLHDAIDRVVRGPCPDNDWRCSSDYRTMCLACAAERTQGPTPCGDFPWDTDDVTVSCDYTYTDVKRPWSRNPLVLQGRCTVTCPPEADMLVGPVSNPYGDAYGLKDGAYYCNVGNSTWVGSEPVCLGKAFT